MSSKRLCRGPSRSIVFLLEIVGSTKCNGVSTPFESSRKGYDSEV